MDLFDRTFISIFAVWGVIVVALIIAGAIIGIHFLGKVW